LFSSVSSPSFPLGLRLWAARGDSPSKRCGASGGRPLTPRSWRSCARERVERGRGRRSPPPCPWAAPCGRTGRGRAARARPSPSCPSLHAGHGPADATGHRAPRRVALLRPPRDAVRRCPRGSRAQALGRKGRRAGASASLKAGGASRGPPLHILSGRLLRKMLAWCARQSSGSREGIAVRGSGGLSRRMAGAMLGPLAVAALSSVAGASGRPHQANWPGLCPRGAGHIGAHSCAAPFRCVSRAATRVPDAPSRGRIRVLRRAGRCALPDKRRPGHCLWPSARDAPIRRIGEVDAAAHVLPLSNFHAGRRPRGRPERAGAARRSNRCGYGVL